MDSFAMHTQGQNGHCKLQISSHLLVLPFCYKQARLLFQKYFLHHCIFVKIHYVCKKNWLYLHVYLSINIPRSVPTINFVGIVGSNSRHETPWAFWISLHSFSGSRINTSVGSVNFRMSHHFT